MNVRRSRSATVSAIVSVTLHIVAFAVFACVKFYDYKPIDGSEMSVAFVEAQKTRVLRRSLPTRPAISLSDSPQHRSTQRQTDTVWDHRASSDFYVSDTSEKVFSEAKNLRYETSQGGDLQRPSVDIRHDLVKPIELRESNQGASHTQSDIFGGYELLGEDSLAIAKPEVRIGADADSALQTFLKTVRKKIESKKKYPMSARDAGLKGRSGIKVTILQNGQLEAVEIVDSSGYAALDNAALKSVRNAAPFPAIPEEAGRDKIAMRIYLVFKIT